MERKREKLEIIGDLLKIIKKNPKIKITKLLHLSNLSPQCLKKYIDLLLKSGLIKEFNLTNKGNKLIEMLKKRDNLIERYKLGSLFISVSEQLNNDTKTI